ncbi:MAG TPA: hypothetical protein DCG19_14460 [Cryomorphaceae bacterium]|nr:hypothetical protein [Owenweeksia sp.]MBF99053.1 hypothetical protein [Owenweeksia sp.]HAD98610.1 hypothetical protein [Cryomorphaceae bacterium]HBF21423.1 hypothetical protein [Cryomorphaceae bacterium]|tara:strand:+ start:411 stop:809 length:399 start_codon:yes stop_codon:yes gene_type:complete
MKRSSLETIVLVLGIVIIGIALFMMFMRNTTPQSIFITNLIFSVGFLIYILYSMMTTNSLNREIRKLNNHITSLKDEIAKKEMMINEKDSRIHSLQNDLSQLQGELDGARKQVADLQNQVREIQSAKPDTEA